MATLPPGPGDKSVRPIGCHRGYLCDIRSSAIIKTPCSRGWTPWEPGPHLKTIFSSHVGCVVCHMTDVCRTSPVSISRANGCVVRSEPFRFSACSRSSARGSCQQTGTLILPANPPTEGTLSRLMIAVRKQCLEGSRHTEHLEAGHSAASQCTGSAAATSSQQKAASGQNALK